MEHSPSSCLRNSAPALMPLFTVHMNIVIFIVYLQAANNDEFHISSSACKITNIVLLTNIHVLIRIREIAYTNKISTWQYKLEIAT
jgi:hypothetical protein